MPAPSLPLSAPPAPLSLLPLLLLPMITKIRTLEWPEKGYPCSNNFDRQDGTGRVQERMYSGDSHGFNFLNISDGVAEQTVKPATGKPHERSHWYISNAEVQVKFGRIPIWENSKICFYSMNSGRTVFDAGGESEIEKISANEVEIRRKELLPRL
ncbi:unnamed protein product [Trifolium pratense]|uniref:Uncharacterized protein n=1 Tax=Trifolium pratense TaxID=57577 RepID=A0ACB0IAU3_TRIPR|nr:unnamed protein product [Trifolium pratense]